MRTSAAIIYIIFSKNLIALDLNIHNRKYIPIIHYAIIFLLFTGISQVLEGIRFMIIGALRGLKDTKIPMFISILSFWVVALPISYLFAFKWGFSGTGLWIGLISGIAFAAVFLIFRLNYLLKHSDFTKMLI